MPAPPTARGSYMIAGEDQVFFHVSSIISSPVTDSQRMADNICRALEDIADLFERRPGLLATAVRSEA